MDAIEAVLWLALNIYFEARNQPVKGQYAVAHVTLNRANQKDKSIKEVILEPGQFSWVQKRHRKMDAIQIPVHEKEAFNKAVQVALLSYIVPDPTNGATHYHAIYVRPKWATKLKYKIQIGKHIFFQESSG